MNMWKSLHLVRSLIQNILDEWKYHFSISVVPNKLYFPEIKNEKSGLNVPLVMLTSIRFDTPWIIYCKSQRNLDVAQPWMYRNLIVNQTQYYC